MYDRIEIEHAYIEITLANVARMNLDTRASKFNNS